MLKSRDVKHCLRSKLQCEVEQSHHVKFRLVDGGTVLSSTYLSHGSDRDLSDFLVRKMAEQLNLTKGTFVRAVQCSRSRDDVLAEVRSRAS